MKNNLIPLAASLLVFAVLLTGCDPAPVPAQPDAWPAEFATASEESLYTCPMHPNYLSVDAEGSCPICGMDLVPATAAASGRSVAVDPAMIQTMGIRTAEAGVTTFGRSVRAFGTVETDERLEAVSASRLEGWIRSLEVSAIGDAVQQGDLLFRIYSPNLISAQQDYLQASGSGDERRKAAVLQRLESVGMQAAAIDQLIREETLIEEVPVYAEATGTVVELEVSEGDYVKPGDPVLRLQSFARVWVMARIPEQDLPLLRGGLPARLTFPSAPGAPGSGYVDYIYPTIDSATRTGRVRIEVDNDNGLLRPGAYADITLDLPGEPRLSVPTEAVLRDSRGAHVIVALGDGRFAPRTLSTGLVAGERTEVLAGLAEGERVVASGQFLLDSEVNLREGLIRLQLEASSESKAEAETEPEAPDPHAAHRH